MFSISDSGVPQVYLMINDLEIGNCRCHRFFLNTQQATLRLYSIIIKNYVIKNFDSFSNQLTDFNHVVDKCNYIDSFAGIDLAALRF